MSTTDHPPIATDATTSTGDAGEQAAAVEALNRVLHSTAFGRAPRSRDLLAFVVTETLAGRGHLLNERVVSRLALERPPTLDTRTDASARVQARRTRDLLDRYYTGEGADDPLRIAIPVGQYAATFSPAGAPPDRQPAATPEARPAPATGTIGPVLAVVGLRHGRGAIDRRVAAGLTETLVGTLARFPGLRVVGPVTAGEGTSASVDVRAAGVHADADVVLHGSVLSGDDAVRVTMHLSDGATGEVRWSETFEHTVASFTGFAAEDDIVRRVVGIVGDTSGLVLRGAIRPDGGDGDPVVIAALAQYYAFLDELTPDNAPMIVGGLLEALEHEPDNAHVLASLGFVFAIDVLMRGTEAADSMATAQDLGRQALGLDPASATANCILGVVALAKGNHPGACAHAEEVLRLTPYHPSNAYVAGMLIGAADDWKRGIEIIERVVRVNPYGPNHRRTLLAVDALMRDDVATALAESSLLHFPDFLYGPLLRALCLVELDLCDEAEREFATVLALRPDFLDDPAGILAAAPTIPDHAAEHLARRTLASFGATTG